LASQKKISALKLRGLSGIQFFFLYLNAFIILTLVVILAIIQPAFFKRCHQGFYGPLPMVFCKT
jgi:hypothetical protein